MPILSTNSRIMSIACANFVIASCIETFMILQFIMHSSSYLFGACHILAATCTDGDVHLVGGTTPLNGRVEVCYNNQWGGVCSPSRTTWGQEQATVVCRQLGYPYGVGMYSYGCATSIAFLNVDYCNIRGDQLLGCYSYLNGYTPANLGYYTCTGYSNFGVMCTSKANMPYSLIDVHHSTVTCSSLPSTHS